MQTELDKLQNPCAGTNGLPLDEPMRNRRFVIGFDDSDIQALTLLLKHWALIALSLVALVLAARV